WSDGRCVGAATRWCRGTKDVDLAEATGLMEAIKFVEEHRISKVVIEPDADRIVTAIKKKVYPRNQWGKLTSLCARFFEQNGNVAISWVMRDGNEATHVSARWATEDEIITSMAVPGRRNGLNDDDEEESNGLFEEEVLVEETDTPPHLRDLSHAAQNGDLNALRLALDNLSGSIDEPVEDGDTALHLTCLYGHFQCAQLLLERGADLEAKDEDGAIPLHDACAGGFLEIVQLLFNRASDAEHIKRMLESVDSEGDTPLHHAARGEHADVIRLLLSNGASSTKENLYGKTPAELPEHNTEARRLLEATATAMAI
ncbi:hypothetical protein TSUD_411430, partial [Trifolium subterraneum]